MEYLFRNESMYKLKSLYNSILLRRRRKSFDSFGNAIRMNRRKYRCFEPLLQGWSDAEDLSYNQPCWLLFGGDYIYILIDRYSRLTVYNFHPPPRFSIVTVSLVARPIVICGVCRLCRTIVVSLFVPIRSVYNLSGRTLYATTISTTDSTPVSDIWQYSS